MAKKKPASLKNNWIKIRADAETKEIFRRHAAEEKMPVTIWATYHLMEYVRSKTRPEPPGKPRRN